MNAKKKRPIETGRVCDFDYFVNVVGAEIELLPALS
jgi:hypothetical protein